MTASHHSWSDKVAYLNKSERECRRCGLVKVTRHEGLRSWVEWWREGERLASEVTPPCLDTARANRMEETGR